MKLQLVDRNRNVVFPARSLDGADKFGVVRALMASCKASGTNPHLEFEMDEEFFRALEAQAKAEADAGETENVLIEMQDGRNLPSFLDIPIVVEGGHAPEMSPASFKGA